MAEIDQIDPKVLQDYVATANSGKYKDFDEINSKFPELKGYDTQSLKDYVATANSGKYKTWEEINSKFPEFSDSKKKVPTSLDSGSGLEVSQSPTGETVTESELIRINDFIKNSKPAKPIDVEGAKVTIDVTENTLDAVPTKTGVTLTPEDEYIAAAPKEYEDSMPIIIDNAIERGKNMADLAASLTAVGGNPDENMIAEIAKIQSENRNLRTSEAYQKFSGAKTFSEGMSAFVESPATILTELTLESMTAFLRHGLVRMGTGAVAGGLMGGIPGAGYGVVAGIGATSLNLEYSSKMMELFSEMGVDTSDPKQLEAVFSDDKKVAEARSHALKKGIPVAIFDAVSGGVAGRIVSKPAKTLIGKAGGWMAEMGIQSSLGMGGEVAGQLVAGEEIQPGAILAEGVGELGGGFGEVVVGSAARSFNQKQDIIKSVGGLPITSDKASIIKNQIDLSVVTGEITPEQATELTQVAGNAIAADQTIPPQVEGQARAESLPLLMEKKELENVVAGIEAEKEATDPSFHPVLDERIKLVQDQIAERDSRIKEIISPKPPEVSTPLAEEIIQTETVSDAIPNEDNLLQVESIDDAKAAQSNGDRIFVIDEMEGKLTEIKNVTELDGYVPDQVRVLPRVAQENVQAEVVSEASPATTIYHGTTQESLNEIEKSGFDLSKTADGTIWFTNNKTKIEDGEVAATGKGAIIERSIDESQLKLGGWQESDKYSTGELIEMGYDGLKLVDEGEITYQIFNPEKLGKIIPVISPTPAPQVAEVAPITETVNESISPINTQQNENTKNTPANQGNQKSSPRGTQSENKGIGRGKVPASKRKIKDPVHLKALAVESTDAMDMVMQYFIRGGKVNLDSMDELFGSKRENDPAVRAEKKYRIGLLTKDSMGIQRLAEHLFDTQAIVGLRSEAEFREAIEDTLKDHNSASSMARAINARHDKGGDAYFEQMSAMRARMTPDELSQLDEELMVEDFFDNLSEEQQKEFVANQNDPAFVTEQAEKILAEELKEINQSAKDQAKNKIAQGLEGILSKIGGIKNLTEQEKTTLIEDLKTLLEGVIQFGGLKINEAVDFAIAKLKELRPDITSQDVREIQAALQPTPPPVSEPSGKRRKKALLNRTAEALADTVSKYGLDYEIESWKDAEKIANDFINEVGYDEALKAVQGNLIENGAAAFIWGKLIDMVGADISTTTDPVKLAQLKATEASLMNQFDKKARSGGRFISALQEVYRTSDFPYKLEKIIERLTEVNNDAFIPAQLQQKMAELAENIEKINSELKAHKEKVDALELQVAFEKEQAAIAFEKGKKESITEKANKIAEKVLKGKINRPSMFMAATPASIIWDGALEVVAATIRSGGQIAEAVARGLKHITDSAWYKSLTETDKLKAEAQYNEFATNVRIPEGAPEISIEGGKIIIPPSLVKSLIESGVDNVNDLVKQLHVLLSAQYTDITERMVRDAFTEYGKQRFPSQDEIKQKISQMKRDGKLLSGLEDAISGKAPLRSGFQRPKPTDAQREMERKIKDAMKDLPEDAADVERKWATAQDRIATLLKNRIADLEKQIASGVREKRNTTPTKLSDDNLALQSQVAELNKQLDELVGKKELTYEQRVNNAIAAAERTLFDFNERIAANDLAFKTKPTLTETPELKAVRESVKQARETLNEMRQEAGVAEARRMELYRNKLAKDIKALQKQLDDKQFDKKVRKEPVELDREGQLLEAERLRLKQEVDVEIEKLRLKNRTVFEKMRDIAIDILNIPRTLMASGDLSSLFRQGLILGARHPIMAIRSMGAGLQFAASEKKYEQYLSRIKSTPEYVTMQKAGLYISEPTTKLSAKEEQFVSNLAQKIPLIGRTLRIPKLGIKIPGIDLIARSERAYTGQLNKLRIDVFNDFHETLVHDGFSGKELADNLKSFATFINQATGRGNLGAKLNQASPVLNAAFFAPRFIASRVNILGRILTAGGVNMPAPARIETIKTLGSYLGLGMTVLALAALAGADTDDDPTSSTFGKIKIGNVVYDIWAGEQQLVVMLMKLFLKRTTNPTSGEQIPLNTGGFGDKTRMDVITDFVESKFAPPVTMGVEAFRGKNKYDKKFFGEIVGKRGEEPTIKANALASLAPIWQQDVWAIAEDEGVVRAIGAGAGSFFGLGVQYYDPKPDDLMQKETYQILVKNKGDVKATIKEVNETILPKYQQQVELADEVTEKEAKSTVVKAAKYAQSLYFLDSQPDWVRNVFYSGTNKVKRQLIEANLEGKGKSERKKIIDPMISNFIISQELADELK